MLSNRFVNYWISGQHRSVVKKVESKHCQQQCFNSALKEIKCKRINFGVFSHLFFWFHFSMLFGLKKFISSILRNRLTQNRIENNRSEEKNRSFVLLAWENCGKNYRKLYCNNINYIDILISWKKMNKKEHRHVFESTKNFCFF